VTAFWSEIPYALLIAAAVLVGLWCSNIFYDYKVPQYLSRKIGHLAGGTGLLLYALLFDSWLWPLILSVAFTALLLGARFIKGDLFRGVGGTGRPIAFCRGLVPRGICGQHCGGVGMAG